LFYKRTTLLFNLASDLFHMLLPVQAATLPDLMVDLPLPGHAQQIFARVIVEFQISMPRIMDGSPNPAGKVNIGCRQQHATILFFGRNDAFEGVLGPFPLFDVSRQFQYFFAMSQKKFPFQGNEASGALVIYTVARRAGFLVRARGVLSPLPSPFIEDGAALRANTGLRWLGSRPV
jgi:hypothetical protein